MGEIAERSRERKQDDAATPGIGHNSRKGFQQMRDAFQWRLLADRRLHDADRKIGFALSLLLNRKVYDRDGTLLAWPSHETIAKRTGTHPRTVKKSTERLATLGYVHILRGGKGPRDPNRYVLVMDGYLLETMQ